MSEIEPYDEKSAFLEKVADLRPDLFFPEAWSSEQRAEALELVRPRRTRNMMFASIPMTCAGENCIVADTCPLLAVNLAPVGRPCHPAGTPILTYRHGEVAIEDLDPEIHRLYGYERKYNAIRSGRAGFGFTVAKKHYHGFMVELAAGERSYQATHDHVCVARFNENAIGKFCVYLMRKGDFWRIGKTTLVAANRSSVRGHKSYMGFATRGGTEAADAMWILGVYDTNTEALLAEEQFSLRFQVSKVSFSNALKKKDSKHNGLYRWATTEQIDAHHKALVKDEPFYRDMLHSLGLSIDYPIWKRGGFSDDEPEVGPYVKWGMFIRACNVLPGVMDVPLYRESDEAWALSGKRMTRTAEWATVSVMKAEFAGDVYALGVDTHKTYFAGGIATRNCPLEMAMVMQFMAEYMEELGVNPENLVEVSMIRDLVDQEVQYLRKTKLLAKEHFIQENVVGIDANGNVVMKKELHLAVELEDRLHRRKRDLRNQLLATREAKAKVGQATLDTAQTISNIMDNVRVIQNAKAKALKAKLGQLYRDEYIDEAEVMPPEDD